MKQLEAGGFFFQNGTIDDEASIFLIYTGGDKAVYQQVLLGSKNGENKV